MLFRHQSRLPFAPEQVFAWHARPGAQDRLAPPWAIPRIRERRGTIRDGDEVVMELAKGPLHLTWHLRHRDFEEGRRFTDEQVRGPFQRWVHVHDFEPDGEGGTLLRDEIEWEPPLKGGVDALAAPVVERELERLFAFRERRLWNDLTLHERWRKSPRLSVAITGTSGLIGSALRRFLTAGGHRVVSLVRSRDRALAEEDAVYWSPDRDEIDAEGLRGVDAIVHLAGEPLVQLPRWTAAKKRRIRESRVRGTDLIARTAATLHDRGPVTLVSASAVGYYGDRGDEVLTEETNPGKGFLPEVVKAWEAATRRARGAGVRVVMLRTGPALSPAGGMLEKVLVPFRMGIGGRVGSGRQYVPWLDLDDMMGIILHAIMDEKLQGPVNACAPHPVPNATFADVLGRVLGRPTLIPVPALVVKAALGDMGRETLLAGQRAKPARLLQSGYAFLFEGIEESLRYQLGRTTAGAVHTGEPR